MYRELASTMATLGYCEVLVAVILIFLFIFLYRGVNGLPRNWPVIGMLPDFFVHLHRTHERCYEILERAGGTFLVKGPWFIGTDMLGTVDLANVHYIMTSNFSNYPKGPDFAKIFDLLGDGIFNADSDSWRSQRKLARALINHRQFRRFSVKTSRDKVENGLIPVLNHVSQQGLVVDLQDLFQRFTFDTTCTLVTGYDSGCLSVHHPDVPFAKAMDEAEEALIFRHVIPECIWKLQKWVGVGQEKKLSRAWATLDQIIYKYISMKREEVAAGNGVKSKKEEDGVDLLTSYISIENEPTELKCDDDKFLRDTILNFMLAGRDTTSSALTWFLWLVSEHPVVETKIREELRAVMPEKEAEKQQLFGVEEAVGKLVYLHAALCESLRLYPPVPFQHKEPLEADTLPSGHRVHPKMKILFSLYALGRMRSVWGEDSLEFKPERWISERGTIKHEPSYKFLAFNAGPRTCLGKEVAFAQMKLVAATIIHNYHVQVMEGHTVAPNLSIILYMKHGLMVKITKRRS